MLGEKIAEFAIKHPFITYMIVGSVSSNVRSALVKVAYILRTGKMPRSDVGTNESQPVQQEEEERDKHGF